MLHKIHFLRGLRGTGKTTQIAREAASVLAQKKTPIVIVPTTRHKAYLGSMLTDEGIGWRHALSIIYTIEEAQLRLAGANSINVVLFFDEVGLMPAKKVIDKGEITCFTTQVTFL